MTLNQHVPCFHKTGEPIQRVSTLYTQDRGLNIDINIIYYNIIYILYSK